MEFTSYRDRSVALAVDLVNELGEHTHPARLGQLLERHGVRHAKRLTSSDAVAVDEVRARLREIFAATPDRAVRRLNALLAATGARPRLEAHDGEGWHLHFASDDEPLATRLGAFAAMGLAIVVAEEGFDRLKTCEGDRCRDVFVDLSKNRSRRFCSPAVCGNRASVAAYRRRKREQARA